jgi:replication-associated recombination protein RarA
MQEQQRLDGFETAGKKPEAKKKGAEVKFGYDFGEVASALQKEIRAGNEREAIKWMALLYDCAPYYCWKRIVVCASEDIGFGDVEAVATVNALQVSWRMAKEKSFHVTAHQPAMAVMLLCRAKKNTEVEDLLTSTYLEMFEDRVLPAMPDGWRDMHTTYGKSIGRDESDFFEQRLETFGLPMNA